MGDREVRTQTFYIAESGAQYYHPEQARRDDMWSELSRWVTVHAPPDRPQVLATSENPADWPAPYYLIEMQPIMANAIRNTTDIVAFRNQLESMVREIDRIVAATPEVSPPSAGPRRNAQERFLDDLRAAGRAMAEQEEAEQKDDAEDDEPQGRQVDVS